MLQKVKTVSSSPILRPQLARKHNAMLLKTLVTKLSNIELFYIFKLKIENAAAKTFPPLKGKITFELGMPNQKSTKKVIILQN